MRRPPIFLHSCSHKRPPVFFSCCITCVFHFPSSPSFPAPRCFTPSVPQVPSSPVSAPRCMANVFRFPSPPSVSAPYCNSDVPSSLRRLLVILSHIIPPVSRRSPVSPSFLTHIVILVSFTSPVHSSSCSFFHHPELPPVFLLHPWRPPVPPEPRPVFLSHITLPASACFYEAPPVFLPTNGVPLFLPFPQFSYPRLHY